MEDRAEALVSTQNEVPGKMFQIKINKFLRFSFLDIFNS